MMKEEITEGNILEREEILEIKEEDEIIIEEEDLHLVQIVEEDINPLIIISTEIKKRRSIIEIEDLDQKMSVNIKRIIKARKVSLVQKVVILIEILQINLNKF
jgi:hypothetical protein